ncbi:MAG: PEGA domain-containing protein [Kiritimatiellaeota bacterium]|nr:PEGA domain-containing protein [Kiritimatiellota bacterium]
MKRKSLIAGILAVFAVCAWAQVVTEAEKVGEDDAALKAFKARVQAANPDLEVVGVEAVVEKRAVLAPRPPPAAQPKVAIFVKNQTTVKALDEEVDGIRDRITADLAGAGMIVLDAQELASSFDRFKVTTAEERAGLIDGAFRGGSPLRLAQMVGCDYIMLVSITSASMLNVIQGTTTFNLNMTVKVLEAVEGSTVFGSNWPGKHPVPNQMVTKGNELPFFSHMIDQWCQKTGPEMAAKAPTWRRAAVDPAQMIEFEVSTTIDEFIGGLENGVLGAPETLKDVLGELRRLIGGVTVELDGFAVGSSPGKFMTTPGMHQLRISRQWMKPWQQAVVIQPGAKFRVALELSDEGLARFRNLEGFRSLVAVNYAEAATRKDIKINFDTAGWRDVGNRGAGNDVILQNNNLQR